MTLSVYTTVVFCLICAVWCAPIEVQDPPQQRESTPEILDLEQQLKKQAGEDKNFNTQLNAVPPEQVQDTLDDNDAVAQPAEVAMLDKDQQELQELEQANKILEAEAEAKENEEDSEEDETVDLSGDLAHELEKDEPIPPIQQSLESGEGDDSDGVDLAGDDTDVSESDDDEPTNDNDVDEDDRHYTDMVLEDIVRALKYNPDLVQSLLQEDEGYGDLNDSGYASKRTYMYGQEEPETPGSPNDDVILPADEMGISQMDASDLEAAIRAELLAANEDQDKYEYEPMREEDAEWRKYLSEQKDLDTQMDDTNSIHAKNPERYQMFNSDSGAREVSKKRGYAPPDSYGRWDGMGAGQNELLGYKQGYYQEEPYAEQGYHKPAYNYANTQDSSISKRSAKKNAAYIM